MTEDDKKKAVVANAATDLSPKDAQEAMAKMPLRTLLFDAMMELNAARQEGRPLVIAYRVPCPCGKCDTMLSIQISPYTEVVFDALRRKQ